MLRKDLCGLVLLVAWGAAAPEAWTAAPANDRCSGAEIIPPSGPFPYLTVARDIDNATTTGDPPAPTCQADVSRSLWYSFTPAATAYYTISTCDNAPTATTVADTVMAIYTSSTGCGGPLTNFIEIPTSGLSDGCADDSCGPDGLQAALATQLNAGTTYYILVWQFGSSPPPAGSNTVQLRVSRSTAPINDTCSTAITVLLDLPVSGTTVGANNDYQLSGSACFTGLGQSPSTAVGRDVVYGFTAPAADNYSFKAGDYRAASDLVLYVAAACPMGQPPMLVTDCLAAANRMVNSPAEEIVCLPLAANQRVFIFVDEQNATAGTSFTLEVSRCVREIEPNDAPTNANLLAFGLEGSIETAGDVDFYTLGASPPGSRAFVLVDGGSANDTDFDLRLTTATDTLEYDEGNNDVPFGVFAPNVAGTPLTGAATFIRVNFVFSSVAAEPYRLYAVVQPPLASATVESEPNNSLAQANSAPNNYFYGSLAGPAPSTDVDLYAFSAQAGDVVFLSLDGNPLRDNSPINAKLELLDAAGDALIAVNDSGTSASTNVTTGSLTASTPHSPAEALVYRAPVAGTYYARVSIGTSSTNTIGAGDYLLSISRNGDIGSVGSNTPPASTNLLASSPLAENGTGTFRADFADPDPADAHLVVIDWGDASPPTTNDLPAGVLSVTRTHLYRDDDPSGTAADTYTIRVTITDSFGGSSTTNASVTVTNLPPSLTNLMVTSPIFPNDTVTLSGNIGDPGPDDTLTLSVDWGDGSAPQTGDYAPGTSSFSLRHQYLDSNTNLTIRLTLTDDDTGSQSGSISVTIRPPPVRARLQTLELLPNGQVRLCLEGTPEATYRIQASGDLVSWMPLGAVQADAAGRFQFDDTSAPLPPTRFYRAVWP